MATIEDVAKETGLSRATISRVINDYPYVSDEKRTLVKETMKRLGYTPNVSAQKLRSQRTNMVAVLIPRLTNPFFTELLEGIELVAEQHGYQLLICQTQYNNKKELDFLNLVDAKQVDGVILTSIQNRLEKLANYFDHVPFVFCNEYYKQAKTVPSIRLDQYKGAYMGVQHLIDRGYERIGYCLSGLSGGDMSIDRYQGVIDALAAANLGLRNEWKFSGVNSFEHGESVIQAILNMKERPDAIFTGGDQVAVGIIKAAKENQLHVPGDLAVIGFDDQMVAQVSEPALTTIRQPSKQMGQQAMETMVHILKNEQVVIQQELMMELVIRQST